MKHLTSDPETSIQIARHAVTRPRRRLIPPTDSQRFKLLANGAGLCGIVGSVAYLGANATRGH